jgi:histidinol phosphatase-like PHP family hydrolase
MALVLTKKKVVATKPVFETSTPRDIVELLDEVGAMQEKALFAAAQIKLLQAELKPYAEKAKQLADMVSKHAIAAEINDDNEFLENSEGFVLKVGKAGTLRTVANVELAMKRMGKKAFFEKVTLGLGIIDQYLTPEEKKDVVKTERIVRSITVLRRDPAVLSDK